MCNSLYKSSYLNSIYQLLNTGLDETTCSNKVSNKQGAKSDFFQTGTFNSGKNKLIGAL